MKSVFLSGSRALSRLNDDVRKRIRNIVDESFQILLGDANGADKAMQSYLSEIGYRNVLIHCSGRNCRNNVGEWETEQVDVPGSLRGRAFYGQKDKVMAGKADYGLVLWDGRSPGSIENVIALLKRDCKSVVYFSPDKTFCTIGSLEELRQLLKRCSEESLASMEKKINLSGQLEELEPALQPVLDL